MMLPLNLKLQLEEITQHIKASQLTEASADLSKRYRENTKEHGSFMNHEADYLAYLTTRFPATYGVICRVLKETQLRWPTSIPMTSLLDVGAGPGTAYLAAKNFFNLEKATLIEKDRHLMTIGKKITDHYCVWLEKNLEHPSVFNAHDLVIMSYVLGELPEDCWPDLFKNLFNAANHLLIIIEPGTPLGFKRILTVRNQLLAQGAHLVAPCTHQNVCPLNNHSAWCHFPQRIERSTRHRQTKQGTLGYEDEKFSYIVLSKQYYPFDPKTSRVINRPEKHSGHVCLSLCTDKGIEKLIISRKHKNQYKQAKKTDWGCLFNTPDQT